MRPDTFDAVIAGLEQAGFKSWRGARAGARSQPKSVTAGIHPASSQSGPAPMVGSARRALRRAVRDSNFSTGSATRPESARRGRPRRPARRGTVRAGPLGHHHGPKRPLRAAQGPPRGRPTPTGGPTPCESGRTPRPPPKTSRFRRPTARPGSGFEHVICGGSPWGRRRWCDGAHGFHPRVGPTAGRRPRRGPWWCC